MLRMVYTFRAQAPPPRRRGRLFIFNIREGYASTNHIARFTRSKR
mgnify:CR=1 FL=1